MKPYKIVWEGTTGIGLYKLVGEKYLHIKSHISFQEAYYFIQLDSMGIVDHSILYQKSSAGADMTTYLDD